MTEETIFTEALQKPDPAGRSAYLDATCGGDAALRRRVEALLAAHEAGGSFLEPPFDAVAAIAGGWVAPPGAAGSDPAPDERLAVTSPDPAAGHGHGSGPMETETRDTLAGPALSEPGTEGPGAIIGPYKLLHQIGEGGMGTVYLAEQERPVRRRVALKVIKAGMDTRQVIARFEAERQALALMDHVHIARVLDAGTTDGGRPYFVMELVHGVPITSYCDSNRLTPRQRLELFVPVCRAIQHAHQKGIIHRDIKPSNVLVTLHDGVPVPKVIDFGVAKAIEQTLTERSLFTQHGTLVGTLEYMSPEQAEMGALGVDTRSDVYSLGVLLYELLTGGTPLGRERVREAAYAEVLRMIREDEPPRPSTRLGDSGERLASISAQRHTEPARLTRLVRGELDWIVMKALEKDRTRRYETADGLAADVRRYLDDEPVQACPPSAAYRFRKFARRNKRLMVPLAVAALALVAGTAVSTWQAVRATRAERRIAAALAEAETQRARAEANLARARAAAERIALDSKHKSEFLANMSREFRTPLNSLLIRAERLADNPEGNLTEKQRESARTIYASGSDLLSLIDDLLDLAGIESGTMVIEVGDVPFTGVRDDVERTFRPVARTKGLDLAVELDRGLPRAITTDAKRLQQILRNLLSRAFKVTESGRVDLRVATATAGWSPDHPVLGRSGRAIAFSVGDSGIGIPPDKLRAIFEPFQQPQTDTSREYGGTGLGLSVSREIARLLGGEIGVRSTVGEGSVFTLYLPPDKSRALKSR